MIICTECEKEMRCEKNGVIATWRNTHRYAGDLFKCHGCGSKVLVTNEKPYHSDADIADGYELVMDKEE